MHESLERAFFCDRQGRVDRVRGAEHRGQRQRRHQHHVTHRGVAYELHTAFRQTGDERHADEYDQRRHDLHETAENVVRDQRVVPGDTGSFGERTDRADQNSLGDQVNDDRARKQHQQTHARRQEGMNRAELFDHCNDGPE